MALTLLAANNAQTVLAAGISSSATSMTVNTGTGALFPSPVSGTSFFKLTLVDAATGLITEIVHVTARTGDTMTIDRGQEGTTARAWSANDIAANMMTAGTLSYLLSNFQPLDATLTALAGLATGANKLPYFTGADTAAQTDLTSVGRDIIGKNAIVDVAAYLGLIGGNQSSGSGYSQNYFKIPISTPSGLVNKIVQYGNVNVTSGQDNTLGLPIPFPTSVRSWAAVCNYTPGTGTINTVACSVTSNTITVRANATVTVAWVAIGD
ncbi:hypothetical protein RQP58_14310 [Enterobacter asburiae]|uniref:gp53-like domain-containing protein n=1 Tax=Enterobacter asburiae TaxID=61645 RepID=UPI0028E93BB5|nr:hypothetical protein [Enterobacter asburiae]WNS31581.1 hypothetical protein RQP58_14310 [Enterobacter asburiae]